jgi:hypothetical protein
LDVSPESSGRAAAAVGGSDRPLPAESTRHADATIS